MLRTMLTDPVWDKLSALMQHTGLVYHKAEHRLILEGILYRMRTGIPWRDLPLEFGRWNTVFVRFNAWSKKGVLNLIFKGLSGLSDREWLFIDGSIVRAHQHSAGAATNEEEAIGKSRGGRSTCHSLSKKQPKIRKAHRQRVISLPTFSGECLYQNKTFSFYSNEIR